MAAEPAARPTIAVFASEHGPGDPERASIMSQAGTLLARRGTRIVCLAEPDAIAVPLITSARAAGGEVQLIADDKLRLPAALSAVPIERFATHEARLARIAALATIFLGLPGSLASAANLHASWVSAGGGAGGKPVVLLNRNRAFEVLRGFSADVLSHSLRKPDRFVVFTDSIDDLWNKVNWALGESGHR